MWVPVMLAVVHYRYFARIADERMAADDQAILVTHQPRWLSDWFWDETACHNLRQLVRGHLRGRARVHLAGLATYPVPYPPAPASWAGVLSPPHLYYIIFYSCSMRYCSVTCLA